MVGGIKGTADNWWAVLMTPADKWWAVTMTPLTTDERCQIHRWPMVGGVNNTGHQYWRR
jgi:hypothetical protein